MLSLVGYCRSWSVSSFGHLHPTLSVRSPKPPVESRDPEIQDMYPSDSRLSLSLLGSDRRPTAAPRGPGDQLRVPWPLDSGVWSPSQTSHAPAKSRPEIQFALPVRSPDSPDSPDCLFPHTPLIPALFFPRALSTSRFSSPSLFSLCSSPSRSLRVCSRLPFAPASAIICTQQRT